MGMDAGRQPRRMRLTSAERGKTVTRFRAGTTAVLACLAALAVVPAALAHHARISGSMDCQGNVSFTASAWQTSSTSARTHNDVRIYVVQSNGATVSPAQQVGSGQFKSSNGFTFSGSFAVPALVNSVKLNVKEIGAWGNGTPSSNGTDPESSIVISRSTSGCTPPPPPPDACPNIAGTQASVPAGMVKDTSGNCVTPPPPPTDQCPNIEGLQTSVPAGNGQGRQRQLRDAAASSDRRVPEHRRAADGGARGNGQGLERQLRDASASAPAARLRRMSARTSTGIQTSVPDGMVKDASGTCATPPSALVTATPTSVATPVVKATPKVKAKVKKAIKKKVVAKKKVVKKKAVKKQSTAAKAKPRALPFTP